MTPLDLTQHPPRSCRAEVDGIVFLPRAIDKVRATLPGGNIGSYLNLKDEIPTLSGLFYHRMRITHEEFASGVASAENDAEVAAWLRARIDDRAVEKFTAQLLSIRLGEIPQEARPAVHAYYPAANQAPDDMLLVDLIDADDAALFASGM